MPCFKGLAVSIHSGGPLEEYGQQRQNRSNRISSYIAVPPARPAKDSSSKLEQPPFAISITLLTAGLNVPYSTPEPSPENPFPRAQVVGGLPGHTTERGRFAQSVQPYMPSTSSPNETIAAYIYFDGRPKEEVATLLRRGEETWVNSRWVSVPDSEGGGLAEREFLFREVGLERWLNGLDLVGSKDKAERMQKRQQRLENKRKKKQEQLGIKSEDGGVKIKQENGSSSPGEIAMQDDDLTFSDSDSDDGPEPEAAGQIKVALFRVLASGEIKRGEYSPQFDAHDDDEGNGQNGNSGDGDGDVDHTTSFAKPKTLDPKTISTQTVTGIDPPESPYATFTFFYRGKRQLQKMGILQTPEAEKTPAASKRKSSGPDFSKLGPLNKFGTVGFSGYRDTAAAKRKGKKKDEDDDAMDSDNDDDDNERGMDQGDDTDLKQDDDGNLLSPEDARRQGEIAEGVQKIKVSVTLRSANSWFITDNVLQLKRQHSAEPLSDSSLTRKSPHLASADSPSVSTPRSVNSTSAIAGTPPAESKTSSSVSDALDGISSPYKRHRGSVNGLESMTYAPLGPGTNDGFASSSTTGASQPPLPQQSSSGPPSSMFSGVGQPAQQRPRPDDSDEEL